MGAKYKTLKNEIKTGRVILPGDTGYEDSLKRWSATNVKPAAVVVQPANAQEVSKAIVFANANSVPFTVCGGGHFTSGQSSSQGGMVIDLRLMRDISVDPARQTISFGGGCVWSDVDSAAARHGLATLGGTVNHTGVGGLVLGGGFGWLSSRHGLTIDVLLEAEVVLADGTVTTASESANRDLF